MIFRIDPLPQDHTFLLFGARGTGKTTLLKERFDPRTTHLIDLLNPDEHLALTRRPATLNERLAALDPRVEWVVIDEIQKVPALLDVVHAQLETGRFRFGLTGSSARKLNCLSLDPTPKRIGAVRVLPWRVGLQELGLEATPRGAGV